MNKIENIIVIQARIGSRRYPAKMLAELNGNKLIEWVIKRVAKTRMADAVILATSKDPANDVLEKIAMVHNLYVYRGSEDDVLSRFIEVAKIFNPLRIIRVCADNPFVDFKVIDDLIFQFLRQPGIEYLANHRNVFNTGYADGFGAEMMSLDCLLKLNLNALTDEDREHVTIQIYKNPSKYRIGKFTPNQKLLQEKLRFDVDVPEDMRYLSLLVEHGVSINSSAEEIIKVARGFGCEKV